MEDFFRPKSLFLIGLFLATAITFSEGLAVMSVDLGGEFMKIAIVKPGVPMEIVLNKESSRKTKTIVAFRDGERQFSNQAFTTSVRFPRKAFMYLMHVIGKHYSDPQIEMYKNRFPFYTLVKDDERETVLFQTEDGELYSPEELLAMVLEHAREVAEAFAEQPIRDAVITVPVYFNQAERRAVKAAAAMIDMNVLQLMSDNAAVALNYGVFRRKNFNSTTQYYMFYDIGASSTVVTIVGYQVVKMKDGTRTETNPQLTIKGVGFDRSLGGLAFTLRLRDHLAQVFNSQKKTSNDVFKNERSMAKLLKEADRVKHVLSANSEHYAQVEGLLDEQDFRAKVTRAELEEMCSDLFERVLAPIDEALKVSQITLGEISDVILMGGGSRIPKIQDLIMKHLKRKDLGKSINTDEAAALGAVYQAAYMGKGFKVKRFSVKEGNIYPIVVEFDRLKKNDDGAEALHKVTRQLFGRMNPFPQRKVMTFNKHFKDFSFAVGYGDLDFLKAEEKQMFVNQTLTNISLSGVETAASKYGQDVASKGVKAHFHLDESGILLLDKVESVFEREVKPDAENETESTWAKLGSALGGLFGGSKEEKKADEKDSASDSKETSSEATDSESETGKSSGENESEKTGDKETDKMAGESESQENTDDAKKDDSSSEGEEGEKKEEVPKKDSGEEKKDKKNKKKDKDAKAAEAEKKAKPTKEVLKEAITADIFVHDLPDLTKDKFSKSKKRLADLKAKDKEKLELEVAKNDLEAYIFDRQTKLSQEEYERCSTEKEREDINQKLAEASDWLYEQPDDTKKEEYKKKLKELKTAMKDVEFRVYETQERPRALEALKSTLNHSRYFLLTVKNLSSSDDPVFTEVEVTTLEKLINETLEWRNEMVKEQKKLADHETPKLLVETVATKIQALDREIKYLINKAKNYKPKTKPKAKDESKNSTKSNDTVINDEDKKDNETKSMPEEEDTKDTKADDTSTEQPDTGGTESETATGKEESDATASPEDSSAQEGVSDETKADTSDADTDVNKDDKEDNTNKEVHQEL